MSAETLREAERRGAETLAAAGGGGAPAPPPRARAGGGGRWMFIGK